MAKMSVNCVLVVISLLVSWFSTSLYVEGVVFRLDRGTTFFTTTDPININNISIDPSGDGLLCQSEMVLLPPDGSGGSNWYINPENESTATEDQLLIDDDRGWVRTRVILSSIYHVIMKREAATGAVEGIFTCQIGNDINPTRSLYVLYPISVTASIDVVGSATDGRFRVQCTSTGGIALTMYVTGPDGYSSNLTNNIQPVFSLEYIGNDRYTASTSDVTEGNDGDMYECTVTSSTSNTDSVVLRVANAPTVTAIYRTENGILTVEWSPPVGGASVVGYTIHYSGSDGNIGTDTDDAGSTSDNIAINDGVMYTVTVEARSEHLSGESEPMIFIPVPPGTPMNVMAVNVGTTSVSVSWDVVNDADRYTVTFTRATGDEQQGACTFSTHTASVTVDAPSTTASIDIGQDVEESDMLRAYSTYFITVVASNGGGNSEDSGQLSILTSQIGAAIPPANVRVTDIYSFSITVQWNAPSNPCKAINGLITSYSIRYTIQPNGIPQTTLQSDGLEITLTELTPFTEYSIEVAAVNENDDVGVYSVAVSNRTNEAPPGPVGDITSFSSFFTITITWEQPAMPNGELGNYRVEYGLRDSTQTTEEDVPDTTFTTPNTLERGTEYTFTVTARTRAGLGTPTTVNVTTLDKPPTVEEVIVASLNDTSVIVLWNALVIPGYPIYTYTVIYSPVTSKSQEEREMMIIVPGSVTSIVITGLNPSFNYQFQVFATVIIDGQTLEGERNNTVTTIRDVNMNSECQQDSSSATPIIIGVIIGIAVGVSGLIVAVIMFIRMRAYKGGGELSTDHNPSYGLNTSQYRRTDSNGEYEIPEYITTTSVPTVQEAVYEGVN